MQGAKSLRSKGDRERLNRTLYGGIVSFGGWGHLDSSRDVLHHDIVVEHIDASLLNSDRTIPRPEG